MDGRSIEGYNLCATPRKIKMIDCLPVERDENAISLTEAEDLARTELRFFQDVASQFCQKLTIIEAAVRDGQYRIRTTGRFINELVRRGTIEPATGNEILSMLLRADENS
jgi:hypothetical protein